MVVIKFTVLSPRILNVIIGLILLLFEIVVGVVLGVLLFIMMVVLIYCHPLCWLLHISWVTMILFFSLVWLRIVKYSLLDDEISLSLVFYNSEAFLKTYQVLSKLLLPFF